MNYIMICKLEVRIVILIFLIAGWQLPALSQGLIIDHTCTDITKIPESAINQAKTTLHIGYGHTSHGSQLTYGMTGLVTFANNGGLGLSHPQDIFAWNNGGTDGALDLEEGNSNWLAGDCGYFPQWVDETREYLDDPSHADVNVIIWSWCGQVSILTEQQIIDNYLSPMSQLEVDYPNVTFVYMTGHTDGTGETGNLSLRNEQIRNYCIDNDKVLYDFYDIECYDPDGTYFGDQNVSDDCSYTDGNWAIEWQNSHIEGLDWYDCISAHSEPINANLKAYAAWWLWASLAGWNLPLQDSLALVALYDSTDGTNWTDDNNWLTGQPVSTWFGVTVTENYVTQLDLRNNNLNGTIPPAIGDLDSLTHLILSGNQLSGSIPLEIGNLTALKQLILDKNQLTASIPASIGNLTSLTQLFLQSNQLTGAVPSEIVNISTLNDLGLEKNLLEDLPDLSLMSNLAWLVIHENRFTFEDIEPNIGVPNDAFIYSPQDSVGIIADTILAMGASLTLSVTVGGTANQYQWMKDGLDLPGADSSSYSISSAESADSGDYICKISNTLAVELILYSRPFNVTVEAPDAISKEFTQIPDAFALQQNFPNPFNPSTRIEYALPKSENVKITVHNALGQAIETLVDKPMPTGHHEITFNAENLPSGVYFYRIQVGDPADIRAGEFQDVKKMVLLK